MSSRLRRIGDLVVGLLALALVAAPSAGAALPAGYTASPIENPSPATVADHFGANIVNAGDVNGDGKDDLLVGVPDWVDSGALPGISGKVVFLDGQTGGTIATVEPPPSDTLISHAGANTDFGAQVATIGDLNGDGVPEHVVSAPGSDITASAVDMGIVYVLDGKTNAVMKRIELAPDDRPGSSPGFGKALTSAGGEPACQGFGGTAPCPDAPSSLVARGDLDGGGESDIVIGAPDYQENAAIDTNPDACPGPGTCPGLGRAYVYSGENIVGAPATPLDTPTFTIKYFDQTTAAQQPHLGAVLSPIGDVGSCAVTSGPGPSNSSCLVATPAFGPSNVPDGYPDYLISAPGLSAGGVTRAGQTFVVDGQHGVLIAELGSPDPQQDSGFGPPANHQTAPGNLGASGLPDVYLSATGQDFAAGTGQGRGYVFDGDVAAPNLLARLDDPSAAAGSGFGVFAGLGDVAGDDGLNELALGRLKGGPVLILSACGMTAIQTIPDADPGAGFGAAIAPMGDLNGDGYLDLAIGAPDHNSGVGRVFLMKSNGSPGPDLSCKPPAGGGGGSGGGGSGGGSGGPHPGKRKGGGKKLSSLAKRSISFGADKKTVKIPGALRLSGRIKSSKRKGSCERKQKVAIQRLAHNKFWQTIDVAVTRRDGRFGVQMYPGAGPLTLRTYRADVKRTRRCMRATSNRVKVRVVN